MAQAFLFLSFFYAINIYPINAVEKLPREINKAITKFKEVFPMKESYAYTCQDHSIKDSISYYQKKMRIRDINTLPKANWNQSRGKVKINYDRYEVHIKKYNIRKQKNCSLEDLYKLWKYEVYEEKALICTILWTEKGNEYFVPITLPITLHDLRFLIPFMQPEVAQRIFGTM